MTRKRRLFVATMFALLLTVFVTTSAFAHFCTNPNKKDGAGSIATITLVTLEDGSVQVVGYEANKKLNANESNGGFITIVLDGVAADLFAHVMLPDGALAAGPDGLSMCDGHGIDFFIECAGLEFPES